MDTKTITLEELPLNIRDAWVLLTTEIRVPGFEVEAFGGFLRAHVIQTGSMFVPCYLGAPEAHNPWTVRTLPSGRSDPASGAGRSCICPVVHLAPQVSLSAAARAAINAYVAENGYGGASFQVEG